MAMPRLATDSELERIYENALTVLETVGSLVQDEELKGLMLGAGCREGAKGQVVIPRELVEEMLAPRLAEAEAKPDGPARIDYEPTAGIGGQLAQFYLDPETGERLEGSRELLAEVARFGHATQGSAGPVLLCRDVPAPVEPMEAVLTLALQTDNVSSAYLHSAEQIPYLAELGEILNGEANSFLGICLFLVTPLRMDLRASRLLVELMGRGAHVWLGTQPAAGASSPVTVAGTVTLAAAELLGAWVAAYVVNPEAMPGGGICSGALDMKTADVSYCAPEAMLQDLLTVELFRERCGGRCSVAGAASYTDAKWPGTQKAFESAFEALTIWMYTGHAPSLGSGLLESGKTFSPVQLMLDNECSRHVGRFARGVSFGEEDMALDAILEVGLGLENSHMTSEHTLRSFRSLYSPRLLDRSCWTDDAPKSEERLLARAAEEYHEALGGYEEASVGEEKLAAVRGVVERASAGLCGG